MTKPYKAYYYDKELIHVYSNDSEVFEYLDEPVKIYNLDIYSHIWISLSVSE